MPQASGEGAIKAMGGRINEVASWYGISAERLAHELRTDSRLKVDRTGRLLFMDDRSPPVPADGSSVSSSMQAASSVMNLDDTFRLHSRPGASRTIYLNFKGALLTNTVWNSGSNVITAAPYDFDGNPGSFSATELQRIQFIWQRVAEDYAPFDVDITTEQPDPARIIRSDLSDQQYGTTVLITKTTGVYSCSCGGIAYLGVFNAISGTRSSDYYKPALVFYDMLGNGAEKPVAEAISHEAGHNMGLRHDGTSTSAYYIGQGSDPVTGWAPIMGAGYYKPLVQFSKGEYADANNKEDDFSVAQSFGLPLRSDDYGNTPATAAVQPAAVSGGAASITVDGVIETSSDRDVFAISSGSGLITAFAVPALRSPNADIVLSLIDASGNILASSNPLNRLDAALSFSVPSRGTYYLEVKGTGQGDPAKTGYSSYGSVGSFRLNASFPAPASSAPTAVLSASVTSGQAPLAVTLDGSRSIDDGRVTSWIWNFGDGSGDQPGTQSSVTHVYRSAGSYRAQLTVVDDGGLRASATAQIVVSAPAPQILVRNVQVSPNVRGRNASASAVVSVVDGNGAPIKGAVITGVWSGAAAKTSSAQSDRNGNATFKSPVVRGGGCFNFTVSGAVRSGYQFVPASGAPTGTCG